MYVLSHTVHRKFYFSVVSTFLADEISGSSDTEIRLQETFAMCKEIRNQDPMSVTLPVDPTPLLVSYIDICICNFM